MYPVKYTIHPPESNTLAENFQNVNPRKILFLQGDMLAWLVHVIGISTDRILLAGGSDSYNESHEMSRSLYISLIKLIVHFLQAETVPATFISHILGLGQYYPILNLA